MRKKKSYISLHETILTYPNSPSPVLTASGEGSARAGFAPCAGVVGVGANPPPPPPLPEEESDLVGLGVSKPPIATNEADEDEDEDEEDDDEEAPMTSFKRRSLSDAVRPAAALEASMDVRSCMVTGPSRSRWDPPGTRPGVHRA